MWTRRISNDITSTFLYHPLQNPVTNFQTYYPSHYTVLITNNIKYYNYDGLGIPVPSPTLRIHEKLRDLYMARPKHTLQTYSLFPEPSEIIMPHTPTHTDDRSYAMHMLLTSLSTIYQGTVLVLPYSQSHAHQLSRMHPRYVITGEITHWTK